jgi:cell fate (sporulation/competence/biofilm development) regulator YmcA (YheA/YmcA/DUF963 family)
MAKPVQAADSQAIGAAGGSGDEMTLKQLLNLVTQKAIHQHNGQMDDAIKNIRVSQDFTSLLNDIRARIKPDGENTLSLDDTLKSKLDAVKNYAQTVEASLAGSKMSDAAKAETVEAAKMMSARAEKIIADIEQGELTPQMRRDIKEDVDNLLQEISQDTSMQMNMLTRKMSILHEVYAMARGIEKTDHETRKNPLRHIAR